MVRKREIICEYQPYVDQPPVAPQQLYQQACAGDAVTVETWRHTWIDQAKANHVKYGPFKDKGLGKLFGAHRFGPAIVVGSGPSLKLNAHQLKDNPGIPVISCLHNFALLEDLGVGADYYVTLDAGPVTVQEVTEGGKKTPDEYWALTKNRVLLAYVGSHPDLLAKWQGTIFFFNCPIPDQTVRDEIDKVEKFHTSVSTGGNVMGAATYIAKAFFGCHTIAFLGADLAFSYDDKLYGWESGEKDAVGANYLRATDVFGNSVKTWGSYSNFKAWFDRTAILVPGEWVNCTEGGTLGAYPTGNIRAIKQIDLVHFLEAFKMHEHKREQSENPETDQIKILF